jgi:hypothetical protein
MIADGCTENEIALAAGYTARGVRKRKARARALHDPRQGTLF